LAETAGQSTYERLLERIVNGTYAPAMRLVNRSVAEDLGVSVIPVREALGRLVSEGLVEHIPGAGSFVRALDKRELAKLYALREHLEIFAVSEAAKNAVEYQIQHLQRCCENSAKALQRAEAAGGPEARKQAAEAWIDSDAAFHSAIIEAADNVWLGLAVERLRILAHVARTKPRELDIDAFQVALDEHVAIVKAIESHNGAKGESLMRKHIQRAMHAVLAGAYENG